jgi:hypothetical protein
VRAPEREWLQGLHRAYGDGQLEVVVGAGASMASGLPSWDVLVHRLIRGYLEESRGAAGMGAEDFTAAAHAFAQRFGREAVVDVIRASAPGPRFAALLRRALYAGTDPDVSGFHLELAALAVERLRRGAPRSGLLTFNFDDLLEHATHQLAGAWPKVVVAGEREGLHVAHLHGYLPLAGEAQGELVLSELDYHGAREDWASRRLRDLLELPEGRVLLVGMSLEDPRLRSLLIEREKRRRDGRPTAHVSLLVSRPALAADAPLIERMSHAWAGEHELRVWERWGLEGRAIHGHHELVPFFLRQVRLGFDGAGWARAGARVLAASQAYRTLYAPETQREALAVLQGLHTGLRRLVGFAPDEVVHLGAFVPTPEGQLRLGLSYRGADPEGDVLGEERARRRTLSVALEAPQGAAAKAFLQGTTLDVPAGSPEMDAHFTPEMERAWRHEWGFRSLLCLPVYGSSRDVTWAPIGVVCLTSSRKRAFWSALDAEDFDLLQTYLRNGFDAVLGRTGGGA